MRGINSYTMKKLLFISLSALYLLSVSCAQTEQNYKSPKGYNLKEGAPYKMPEELLEISGITFHKGNPDTLFAIQDEDGKLYYGKPMEGGMRVRHTKFGKHGDYEDLAICGNQVIVLKSNGKLYTFPLGEIGEQELSQVQEHTALLPPGEYVRRRGQTQSVHPVQKLRRRKNHPKQHRLYI
jgi:hypothetical protein